jgi:hypothetical protein
MAKQSKCTFIVRGRRTEKKFPTSINGWNKAASELKELAYDDNLATLALQCSAPGGYHEGSDEVVIALATSGVQFDVSPDTFNRELVEDPDRALFGRARIRRRRRR